MMNEEKPTLQSVLAPNLDVGSPVPGAHPLHMLDNQADPQTKPKIVLQKPIRTYESDMAELLAKKNVSVTTMAIAEQQKRVVNIPATNTTPSATKNYSEDDVPKGNFSKKLFMFILSLIFIISGIGGGYYLYLKSPLAIVVPDVPVEKFSGLLKANSQKSIPIGSLRNDLLANKIQVAMTTNSSSQQKISEFVLTDNQGSTTIKLSSSKFIEVMGYSSQDMFNRSLLDSWMLGTYAENEIKTPFIILKTDFFQNAFAGILRWEQAMPDELATLLNYKEKIRQLSSTGTSSVTSYFSVKGKFEDRVILNRDVREFITENRTTLLVYSFVDKDTIVITTSESILKSLILELEKQTYIR